MCASACLVACVFANAYLGKKDKKFEFPDPPERARKVKDKAQKPASPKTPVVSPDITSQDNSQEEQQATAAATKTPLPPKGERPLLEMETLSPTEFVSDPALIKSARTREILKTWDIKRGPVYTDTLKLSSM
jgi:hypothetical protein